MGEEWSPMKQIKRSDIPLLSRIREKQQHMDHMQMRISMDLSESPGESAQLAYSLMEQLDTLNQLKRLESSICNDHHDDSV